MINNKKQERYTKKEILEYWSQQAKREGLSPSASWSDTNVIEMGIRQILGYIENCDYVLDVGCANGYSTFKFAQQKKIRIKGVDVTPEMIALANIRLKDQKDKIKGTIEFSEGDILSLNEQSDSYDKVIVIRTIINLSNINLQKRAIKECIRVLKHSGILILSEATLQGWRKLNTFRREFGLDDIPMPPFNLYIDQEQLVDMFSSELELIEICDFASTYYVGTRVLKPLLIKAFGLNIDVANPDMELNRWFGILPPWGDYGTQKCFVFRKK